MVKLGSAEPTVSAQFLRLPLSSKVTVPHGIPTVVQLKAARLRREQPSHIFFDTFAFFNQLGGGSGER
jgi:hypothetical protein